MFRQSPAPPRRPGKESLRESKSRKESFPARESVRGTRTVQRKGNRG